MIVRYSPEADILFIELNDNAIVGTNFDLPGLSISLDAEGKPCAIEIDTSAITVTKPTTLAFTLLDAATADAGD